MFNAVQEIVTLAGVKYSAFRKEEEIGTLSETRQKNNNRIDT